MKTCDQLFWQALDELIENHTLVIDRPRASIHPRFSDFMYPVDYGYLAGTKTIDGHDVDIWVGTAQPKILDALMCTVDPLKKDVEVKLLYGCTRAEKEQIYALHNQVMRGMLIKRDV